MLTIIIVGAASLIVGIMVGIPIGLWLRRLDYGDGYLTGRLDWRVESREEVA